MRYYVVQWYHDRRGWIDLLSLASTKEGIANDDAEEFANRHRVATRVIRKPKSWSPPHRWGKDGPAKFVLSSGKTIDVILELRGDWVAHEVGTDKMWTTNMGPFDPTGWGFEVKKVFQEDESAPR